MHIFVSANRRVVGAHLKIILMDTPINNPLLNKILINLTNFEGGHL